MKVSILSVNRQRMPEPVLPLGPAVVAGLLRAQGHVVRILDLCWMKSPEAAIVSHLRGWDPDLVGMSLRNLENNQMIHNRSYLEEAKRAVTAVRSVFQGPVLLGGAGYSLFPAELLEALDVPFGLAGDAEVSLLEMVRAIEQGRGPDHVLGAGYRNGDRIVVRPAAKLREFGSCGSPAFDLVDCARYLREGAVVPIETKRGCDLGCIFCPEGADAEGARIKPAAQVVDEIEAATRRIGTNRVSFLDGIFQHPRGHALAVCQEIDRRRLDVRWSAGVNPHGLSRELLTAMKRAGCVGVSLGLDAVTPAMLRSYRKRFDREAILRAALDLRAVGIPFAVFVLFGGPGETEVSVAEGLAFLESHFAEDPVFLALGLRVFRGTPLVEQARREGRLADDRNLLAPTYYLSPAIHPSLLDRLEAACASRPRWFTLPSLAALSTSELQARFRPAEGT